MHIESNIESNIDSATGRQEGALPRSDEGEGSPGTEGEGNGGKMQGQEGGPAEGTQGTRKRTGCQVTNSFTPIKVVFPFHFFS